MKRRMRISADELIVDNFAGGGGASRGIELALGRSPDIAVNHDPEAIAMHEANHPLTRHFCESVWKVDPRAVTRGRPVGLAWFSPDCTFHSKARGGVPFRDPKSAKGRRGLAWVVVRWARAVKPRVIALENVEEFQAWGPLGEDGRPCPARRGRTFHRWVAQLRNLGYAVEWRELRACDYGAPTTRKRLFIIARCDGQPIVWPKPTHGPAGALPHRTAAECIDWTLPCPSIFDRARPLAEKTLARIARGVRRFVLEAAEPFVVSYYGTSAGGWSAADPAHTVTTRDRFAVVVPSIVPLTHAGGEGRAYSAEDPLVTVTGAHRGELALVAPTLVQVGWGERPGQAPRVPGLHVPMGTTPAQGVKHALVAAFLARHYSERRAGEVQGTPLDAPAGTVTTVDHHAIVAAHLLHLHGTSRDGRPVDAPTPTVLAQGTHIAEVRTLLERFGGGPVDAVVCINGELWQVVDIGMRMLTPRELFRAQGFGDEYVIDPVVDGAPLSKTAQVRMCGNSVCPPVARALVEANFAPSLRATRQMSFGLGSAA